MATYPSMLRTSGGARGYDPVYGGVPTLPTSGAVSNNISSILESAIPGYSGLTRSASGIIGDALGGVVPGDVQRVITDASATQAVNSGMPGSNRVSGTLTGNRTLRDLGLTSLGRQDQGVKDLISFLQGVSGTVAPTFAQAQDQDNARAQYASAPIPASAAAEQERLYNKYANPAAGTLGFSGGGGGGAGGGTPWFEQGRNKEFALRDPFYAFNRNRWA